jgi:integrin alpha FG-GAP repeat containing protein 1
MTNSINLYRSDLPFNESDASPCKLADPHSNAFVDLNGDCFSGIFANLYSYIRNISLQDICRSADLFLTCQNEDGSKSFQIWINDKEKGFVHNVEKNLPKGTGQISFADLGNYAM